MTNYKQPHKPVTTIEEIVKKIWNIACDALEDSPKLRNKDTIHYEDYLDESTFMKAITQTLKDYGDAVRVEERLRASRILDDIYDYGITRDELLDRFDFGLNKQEGTP